MLSCYMERLTDTTPDEIREKSVMVQVREILNNELLYGSLRRLSMRSGITAATLTRIRKEHNHGANVDTIEKILKAKHKRLVIVDE